MIDPSCASGPAASAHVRAGSIARATGDRASALALRLLRSWCASAAAAAAFAVQSVRVPVDADAIDLTSAVEHYGAQGDRIQVSTAPGADGIVRRIEVSALEAGAQPAWIVFALTNDSDEQLTRLIVAPHFRFVGSGVVWPDLGSSRITTITASQGSPPEREDELDADVFRLTLDPGTTVTYVAELRTPTLPQLYLWEPDAYKDKVASLTLYKGIVIGIAGLLALFLTIVFVVRGAMVFPAAAALAWAVFAYVCIDFGFWRKIFGFERRGRARLARRRRGDDRRDADRLPVRLSQSAPLARAFPPHRAGLAAVDGGRRRPFRLQRAGRRGRGAHLDRHRRGDRVPADPEHGGARFRPRGHADSDLVPARRLGGAAGAAALGCLTNDLAAPGLIGGLVLIVMLIGFTIMQNAFSATRRRSRRRRRRRTPGAGDDRMRRRDFRLERRRRPDLRQRRDREPARLEARRARRAGRRLARHSAPARPRPLFGGARRASSQQRSGRINHDIRLRGADGRYYSFVLKARPVVNADGEVVRVIGALSDVTEIKAAEERILHDAIHDNLTGLPNRELFFDRLDAALIQAQRPDAPTFAALAIDIDRFKQINDAVGMSFGNSTLLTVARRLGRELRPGDTLARIGGDQFGVIVLLDERRDGRSRGSSNRCAR